MLSLPVTVAQSGRASHGDHVTGPAVRGARNTDWSRHSPSGYRTSRARVRSVGCMRSFCSFVL